MQYVITCEWGGIMSFRHRHAAVGNMPSWAPRALVVLFATLAVALAAFLPAQAEVIGLNSSEPTLRQEEGEEQSLETVLLNAFATRNADPIDVERFGLGFSELNDVYTQVLYDHPELFDVQINWVDATSDGNIITSITPKYLLDNYPDEQVFEMRSLMAKGIADAMSWIPAQGSDLDKVKAAHDWLCSHVVYDQDTANEHAMGTYFNEEPVAYGLMITDREPFYPYCAYGALAAGSCVCEGYAEAFNLLMHKVGVTCISLSAHNHEWNLVNVEGDWYHVDATWDSMRWDPKVPLFEWRSAEDHWVDINYDLYFMKSDQGIIDAELAYVDDPSTHQVVHDDFLALAGGPATNTQYDTIIPNNWDGLSPHPGIQPQNIVSDFSLSEQQLTLQPGQSARLEVFGLDPYDANPNMAVWWSSDPKLVYPLSDGTVLATGEGGTATVFCNILGVERSCEVTVGNAHSMIPEYLQPTVDDTGRIGICVPVTLPEIEGVDWNESRLEYSISGKSSRTKSIDFGEAKLVPIEDGTMVAWFTIPLSSVEMAQYVVTSFVYYQYGEMYKVDWMDTLEDIVGANSADGYTRIGNTMVDLGYYAQLFLSEQNGWVLGADYRAMRGCYAPGYDRSSILDGLSNADLTKDFGTSNVKKVTMSERIDSDSTVDINIYLKKAGTLSASASFCGKTFKAKKVNSTRYRIRVTNILAQDLNQPIDISGKAGSAFSMSLTPMTYAKSVLASSAFGENGDNTMAALYYYHLYAQQMNG